MHDTIVSVIIPVRNEASHIEGCLDDICRSGIPLDNIEVFVIDGCSSDLTVDIASNFFDKIPNLYIITNPKMTVPYAMNLGISLSNGKYIARMDAHARYPNDYLLNLLSAGNINNADNVGGVLKTLPADHSLYSRLISIFMSNKLGVGDSAFRVGMSDAYREVDTVPFGFFKSEIFDKVGAYDLQLVRNQDDELNFRIKQAGGKIVLVNNVVVEYYSRSNVMHFSKMLFQYGLYKPFVVVKCKSLTSLRQLAPIFFVFYNFCLFGCVLIIGFNFLIFTPYLLYFTLVCLSFLVLGGKVVEFPHYFLLSLIGHFSYGLGYLNGLIRVLFFKWGSSSHEEDLGLSR